MTIDVGTLNEPRVRYGPEAMSDVRRPSLLRRFARYLSSAARRTHEFPVPTFDPEG
jgi:hypothetical protein